jgi:predicted Zn-dependent protease
MKRIDKLIFSFLLVLLMGGWIGCSTVPITGRKQVNLLPESEMLAMSLTSYEEFMNAHTLSTNLNQTEMVKSVGMDISIAVEEFMEKNNMKGRLEGFNWQFNLIEEDVPNAWCMPGGKVVVYSGILPITTSKSGLAVVIGHEIAHAVARHGNERMSQALLIQLGGTALDVALNSEPEKTKNLYMAAYGIGTSVGIALPYSRAHENEADKLGLIFMAMAGYDPGEAVEFWARMAAMGGEKPPEFLSTHPSDETRINNLKAFLPEAMKYYKVR